MSVARPRGTRFHSIRSCSRSEETAIIDTAKSLNDFRRHRRRPGPTSIIASLVAMTAAITPSASADDARAAIAAVVDKLGQRYEWTVTNHHDSPIVAIEFTHYKAHLLFAPDGWSGDCTNPFREGWKNDTGECRITCDAATNGIAVTRSMIFKLHVGDRGVSPGPGDFVVRFASGETYTVTGVPVPVIFVGEGQYSSLIGVGSIALLWLAYRWLRRRRVSNTGSQSDTNVAPPSDGGD